MPSEVKFTQDFLEHAAVCTSQYDSTCRAMAAEILALRAEIAKPWEHSDHWRNPETGYIECSCCCDWALDAERDHERIAAAEKRAADAEAQVKALSSPVTRHNEADGILRRYFITGGRQYRYNKQDCIDLKTLVNEWIAARLLSAKGETKP